MKIFLSRLILGIVLACSVTGVVEVNNNLQWNVTYLDKIYGEQATSPIYPSNIRLNLDYRFFCTAVVIDKNYALTAAHCVTDRWGKMMSDEFQVRDLEDFVNGPKVRAVALDKYRDVALLRGDFNNFYASAVNWTGQGLEDITKFKIVQCGFPSGGAHFCSIGEITGNYFFQLKTKMTQVYQGMSGGPVYNATTLEVIGVNSAASSDGNIIAPLVGARENFGI